MLVPESVPFLNENEIRRRIQDLAEEIAPIVNPQLPFVIIGLLRGCLVFTADLIRELSIREVKIDEIDFMVASSYGNSTESSGVVSLEKNISRNIDGCQVLLVDDILDSGRTLEKVKTVLMDHHPAWLKTCVLLVKPERLVVDVKVDFFGFEIPDRFVVGYGLDYDQKYRELPYIAVMRSV